MFSLSSIYCKMCNFSIRLTQQYIDQIVQESVTEESNFNKNDSIFFSKVY